ncbi:MULTISPECIES: hypothetical protein [unclassified Mycolicibacterium]|nr:MULTISPECIES: hypothetical protein [unclassified Mycolicibacterium]MUL72390.1 hypothetical protein [Mycolicibacterium sp. CBMA 311]MUL95209.1 hypothetical protein [Mycolicibacterium sp. CBMA 230]
MRPYVTAGVAMVGASVIAVAPVVPNQALHVPALPQVHAPAVQLTALDNPLAVFAPVVTALQQLAGTTVNAVETSINPLLQQIVINQLYTLQQAQQLIGNVAGGLGTLGAALPGTLQAVGAQLATGNVNGAIDALQNGIIQGGLQLITGISQPVQNILQRPLAVASALVPAMVTTVGSLVVVAIASTLGIGCPDCTTVKPMVQQVVSSVQSVLQAVTTLNPINVINAVQHGIADVALNVMAQANEFLTNALPYIATTIQTALNVNPNTPTGTTNPATAATTAAAVKVSTLSAKAPKATNPAAVPAVTAADLGSTGTTPTGTTSAGAGSTSTTKEDASAPATKTGAAESNSATTPTGSGSSATSTSGTSSASGSSTKDAGTTAAGTATTATGTGATKAGSDTGATKAGSDTGAEGSAGGAKDTTGGVKAGAGKSGSAKPGSAKSGSAKSGSTKSDDSGAPTATKPKAVKAGKSSPAASGASGGHAE